MEQAEDRIHRASTTHDNVQIITYIVQGSVDEMIHDMLRQKSQVVSKVQDNEDFSIKVNRIEGDNIMEALKQALRMR